MVLSGVESNWVNLVREMVQTDQYFKELEIKFDAETLEPLLYQKKGGTYYYKGRILLISPTSPLIQLLISEHHNTPTGGHSGFERTLQRLNRAIYWRGMKKSVSAFVKECDVCQRSKNENT